MCRYRRLHTGYMSGALQHQSDLTFTTPAYPGTFRIQARQHLLSDTILQKGIASEEIGDDSYLMVASVHDSPSS
jgi:hypothetical protein